MTSIALALLSGVLTSQQAQTLSVLCDVKPGPTIECALIHRAADGALSVVKGATTGPLKLEAITTEGLGHTWCSEVITVLDLKGPAT